MNDLQLLLEVSNLSHIEFARLIKEAVLDGYECPIRLFVALKKCEKVLEILKNDTAFMDALDIELMKYGKKPSVLGFTIGQSVRTDFNFKGCKDPYLDELEAKVKDRKAYLKSLIEPTADELSEGVFVNPAKPTTKNIISLTENR
jgi:hypothetical protein